MNILCTHSIIAVSRETRFQTFMGNTFLNAILIPILHSKKRKLAENITKHCGYI